MARKSTGASARSTRPGKARGKLPGHDSDAAASEIESASPRGASRRFVSTKVEIEGREETKIVELPSREPDPWGDDAALHIVGERVARMDALEKVTGRARYTADVRRPAMLYASILRAPIAHGRVIRLDLAPALAIPGVRGAVGREHVDGIKVDGVQLFDQTIHYVGQPLVAVLAETQAIADRARGTVVLEVESIPHAVTATQALAADAPRVRPNGNTTRQSPRIAKRGDVDAGLREADVTITRECRTPVALHTALETHGAVAEWVGERVTVWESTQGIFNTRSDLADALGVPASHVRVIKEYMGGGFGAKNGASHATYIAVAASRLLGRPVRCMADREGEQLDTGNRPATIQRVTLGARRDGTLTAIRLDASIALGIGGWMGGPAKIYHELYRCPNVHSAETFVYINAGAMSSFRAPGHVEGAFGLESAMDALARELDMDPLELRRRNYADFDQEKGRRYSGKHLDECYRMGAERFGWNPRPSVRHQTGGTLRRGRGMASQIWSAGGGPPAYASVRLNGDGSVEVLTGSQDLGTGSRTVFAQIAAEALGARVEDVRTILGDTGTLPYTGNSWGSMTTASVGPAVRVAAEEAKQHLLEAASAMLDAPPDALEARGSIVSVRAGARAHDGKTPASLTFTQICERLGDVMIMGHGSRGPNPDDTAIAAFGAQFAEVEVDTETGHVRVLRIVSAHDSGRIVNPTLAESQLEGGIIQGIGYALFEQRAMDERLGMPLNPTMHDYKIPTLPDVPAIDAFCIESTDVVANHTGAKGLAEPPIIPTAPAIANAVADAIGVECPEIPLTPWRVLAALAAAR